MKLTIEQIKQMIKEEFEEASFDDRMGLFAAMRNVLVNELDNHGRYIDRASGPEIDKMILRIVELSKSNLDEMSMRRFPGRGRMARAAHQKYYKRPMRMSTAGPQPDNRTEEQKEMAAREASESWAKTMAAFYSPEQLEIEKEKVYQSLREII